VPLIDLSGRFLNGEVALSWKHPPRAPDTVFIYPIYGTGYSRRASVQEMSERLLRDASSGTRFRHQFRSPYDVTRCEFLVCLGSSDEMLPDPERLIDDPAFTVTVTVGSAMVYYNVKSQRMENGFEKHMLTLQSAYSLEPGILGYSFMVAGQRFSTAFPGPIDRGKRKYPPFFTPFDAGVRVEVVCGTNADVMAVLR